jgi:hypothetical protein
VDGVDDEDGVLGAVDEVQHRLGRARAPHLKEKPFRFLVYDDAESLTDVKSFMIQAPTKL